MNFKTKLKGLILALALVVTPVSVFASDVITLDVLTINDFHGQIEESGRNIGSAKMVEAIREKRAENPNTLVVSAGDNFNGSALSNLLYGEPVALMLKNMGIIGSAVGNHEYDWGEEKMNPWQLAMGAPFIAANIYNKETDTPVDYVKPYIIKDVKGVKVAFIGLTTQETAVKVKPENVAHIEFKDPVETAKKYVPIVKAEGADIVILLTHIGTNQSSNGKITFEGNTENLTRIKDVDGVITGHFHQKVVGKANGVPVVQAMYNGRAIGKLSFRVNTKTKQIISSEASIDELHSRVADLAVNNAMKHTINVYNAQVGPYLSEVIGQNTGDLTHERATLSPLGQWVAEVMQENSDAQISVTNGGGVRTSLQQGNVTIANMYEVMPFDNVLSIFEMTGEQVKQIFEHGIANEDYGWVQYSGIIVEYDASASEGNRVVGMKLEDGTEISPTGTYRVVTNDFMGTGGDDYSMFLNAKFIGDTVAIRDVMIESFKSEGTVNYKPVQRFIEAKAVLEPAA